MANLLARAFSGLNQVRRGLSTVFGHSFKEPITKEYPQIVPAITTHFRGRLALTVNPETGDHLCISCRQCERVCPDKCIEITSAKSAETGKLELIDFRIDHGLCMFCGLCTEVCPTYCIINTNDFELSEYSREALIYDLKKLTLSQDESAFYFEKKEMPLPKPKPAKLRLPLPPSRLPLLPHRRLPRPLPRRKRQKQKLPKLTLQKRKLQKRMLLRKRRLKLMRLRPKRKLNRK